MANVFYIECAGQIWRDIARACATRGGWTPVLWTAGEADQAPVRALFPEVAFMTGPDAALDLGEPAWPPAAVSDEELQRLAGAEAVAIMMMDRMDAAGTFSVEARRAH